MEKKKDKRKRDFVLGIEKNNIMYVNFFLY